MHAQHYGWDEDEVTLEDDDGDSPLVVKDSNGTPLKDGNSVRVIRDLQPKGFEKLKQGRVFKNIRLTDDEEAVEVREGKTTLVLKTCFLKKQD